MNELADKALANGIDVLHPASTSVSEQSYDSLGYVTLQEYCFSTGIEQRFCCYEMEKKI